MDGDTPTRHGKIPNEDMLELLWGDSLEHCDTFLFEQVASYGMPVGQEVFTTVFWAGRFAEVCSYKCRRFVLMTRNEVKMTLCHRTAKVNDAVIRQRLIDLYGGKEAAIGRKAKPGPLWGIKADVWQALALGRAWYERAKVV